MKGIIESLAIIKANRRAFFGFIVLVFFLLMATAGPLVIPLEMITDFESRYQPISFHHILGTDFAGRDIFQQIVHGSTDIMLIAFSTALFAIILAISIGILAGLSGGVLDAVIMRIIDVFLTVPTFPIMAIFAALFRIRDPVSFGLALALWSWPGLARAIRSQILTIKKREFIEVTRVMGLSTNHIMFRELMPNMIPFITINFINIAKGAITASVGIMLLGLVPLSVTNWGMMLNLATFQTGAIYVPRGLPYLLSPMIAIILFQYAMICFASGVEEIFDPRLRAR